MMVFDEVNRVWKLQVFDLGGEPKGLLTLAQWEVEPDGEENLCWNGERRWTGKPRPRHFETLLQWKHSHGIRYYLLIHFGHDLTEDDYVRFLSETQAAAWLIDEHYRLPKDLKNDSTVGAKDLKISLKPSEKLAYRQRRFAQDSQTNLGDGQPSDKAAHDWLMFQGDENGKKPVKLPTWKRYLRAARLELGESNPGRGHSDGSSIVRQDQI